MYHASSPLVAQLLRCAGLLYATTRVPGGARGVEAKSKGPNKNACADSQGLSREALNRFRVIVACSSSRSHCFTGKWGSNPDNPDIK